MHFCAWICSSSDNIYNIYFTTYVKIFLLKDDNSFNSYYIIGLVCLISLCLSRGIWRNYTIFFSVIIFCFGAVNSGVVLMLLPCKCLYSRDALVLGLAKFYLAKDGHKPESKPTPIFDQGRYLTMVRSFSVDFILFYLLFLTYFVAFSVQISNKFLNSSEFCPWLRHNFESSFDLKEVFRSLFFSWYYSLK